MRHLMVGRRKRLAVLIAILVMLTTACTTDPFTEAPRVCAWEPTSVSLPDPDLPHVCVSAADGRGLVEGTALQPGSVLRVSLSAGPSVSLTIERDGTGTTEVELDEEPDPIDFSAVGTSPDGSVFYVETSG